MAHLSKEEQAFVDKVKADLKLYDQYKDFMAEVKTIFLHKGPEAARQHIRSKTDFLLQIACDDMFYNLFNNL